MLKSKSASISVTANGSSGNVLPGQNNGRQARHTDVPASEAIKAQHMGQHQRVTQAVGDMIITAQGVGQRMHGGNRCIGKRLARQHSPSNMALRASRLSPCLTAVSILPAISRRASRASISDNGFFLVFAGKGFNGMNHGINTSGRCYRRRQACGEACIKNNFIRQEACDSPHRLWWFRPW